jgi:F-type H+-transporting ATPase subunit gamma
MPSLKEVRNRINSVRSTQQITKAMKMVAAAKLRKSQDRILQLRPYSGKLDGILNNVLGNIEEQSLNIYSEQRAINQVLIVVITSDRGLCGGFNSSIIKASSALIQEKYALQHSQGNVHLLCIGKKGSDHFRKRGFKVIETYADLFTRLSFDEVRKAAEFVMDAYLSKRFDAVELVYNEFKNVATQIVRTNQFLPLTVEPVRVVEKTTAGAQYVYEPSEEEIVTGLLPKMLKTKFYKALLESNASENGARMTAMDKATDNAGELLKELKLVYNRSRQAAITKEILEIVGGADALSN